MLRLFNNFSNRSRFVDLSIDEIVAELDEPKTITKWLSELEKLRLKGKWPNEDCNNIKSVGDIADKLKEIDIADLDSDALQGLQKLHGRMRGLLEHADERLNSNECYYEIRNHSKTTKVVPQHKAGAAVPQDSYTIAISLLKSAIYNSYVPLNSFSNNLTTAQPNSAHISKVVQPRNI